MTSNRILLVTKLKTTNIGNQALSEELIKLYEENLLDVLVVGRPTGLYGYSLEKLSQASDPVEKFELWARTLIKILKRGRIDSLKSLRSGNVNLVSFRNFKVRNDSFFQRIKNLFRCYIHSDFLFARSFRARFTVLTQMDIIIYSGAGEVGDNNIFLRQLLELRIAQLLGKKTYAINQSVEVVSSPLNDICKLVYGKMQGIGVRGTVSRTNLESMGINPDLIWCCPDSAFRTPTPDRTAIDLQKSKYGIEFPAVGLNVTSRAPDIEKWGEVISFLRDLGYAVYFVTNDPFGDRDLALRLKEQYKIPVILDSIHYSDYAALLANFSFVISCRLHTNELSLAAGIRVIPIEGSLFKTREVFDLVSYPLKVVQTDDSDWVERLKTNVMCLHDNVSSLIEFVNRDVDNIRDMSAMNFVKDEL